MVFKGNSKSGCLNSRDSGLATLSSFLRLRIDLFRGVGRNRKVYAKSVHPQIKAPTNFKVVN
jgi:hypothetical protein